MRSVVPGYSAGALFGIPFYVEATAIYLGPWVAIIALTQSSGHDVVRTLIFFATLIASVLAHELAHAFAARALGVPVRHIALTWFGGYAAFWVQPTRWRDAAIAFAGPAANLALAGLLFLAPYDDPYNAHLGFERYQAPEPALLFDSLHAAATINLALGLFNLLPGLPLDGGHILRTVLSTRMSDGRAGWIAAWAGVVIGALAIGYAIWIESFPILFLGLFVAGSAWFERRAMRYT